MKNILFIIILAAMTACCPCRHLTTSTRDSVRVETVVRTERIPDTVFVDVPAERERQTVRDTTSHLETSFAISDARINPDGALFHSLENKPQKRPVSTEKEVIYRDSIIYQNRTNTETIEVERKLTWWQQTKMRGFWVLLAVVVFICRKNILSLARRLI
ncbi:hypothetical protein [Alistipes putredinis]|uniref:hypothetical protein n=1 Tax=Alistipes putredinis TaxID=28117 RepID=UPI002431852A|nr:hypothetical protein [Alistipes putredinis]